MPSVKHTNATKAAILDAAGELFASHGFAAVTARQVAAAANVSLSTIPYHFKTMENLYLEALREAARNPPSTECLHERSRDASPEVAIRIAAEFLIDDFDASRSSWRQRLFHREELDPSDAFRGVVGETYVPVFDWLCRLLSHASGDPPESIQVKYGVLVMYSICCGHLGLASVTEIVAPDLSAYLDGRERRIDLLVAQSLHAIECVRANQQATPSKLNRRNRKIRRSSATKSGPEKNQR